MKKLKILNFEFNKTEIFGILIALVIVVFDFIFLREGDLFYLILGIAFFIGGLPFFLFLIIESKIVREKDMMFLEFSRNLVESVRAGTPISKSILNVQTKDYGALNPHIKKLANQISLGIPVKISFQTFARDVGSDTISKAINIISESENAGGEIEDILESVVKSIAQIEKLKKERRNALYGLVVQGYIIFLIFIIIMVIMEFSILPIASGLGTGVGVVNEEGIDDLPDLGAGNFLRGSSASPEELAKPFIWLLVVQGFFIGLVIGKLSEGSVKAGLKHSFVLMVFSILINTGIKVVF